MAITARNLITSALISADAIADSETPSEGQIFRGLSKFNDRIALLSLDNLWDYTITRYNEAVVAGKATYSVGNITLTEDFELPRPSEIIAMTIKVADVWYPMVQVSPIEWEHRTKLDSSVNQSMPTYFTYRPNFPTAEIEVYPTPGANYDVRLSVREMKTEYTLDEELTLPVGYQGYLEYALAAILAVDYGADPTLTGQLSAIAGQRLATIKRQNTNSRILKCGFLPGSGDYDVRTDTFTNGWAN